ncbi:hypothetical protein PC129_g4579 [Phytophthora cactorum]|uniref:Uncharacterized protein n=1 Tax=Phytophthora cactorum TaxID=29920 RepID=A0A8T1IJ45_9STRA|nr:hypothetical protein Pcac1_g10082 [Phytophthora cactorum]KAG2806663.1 hypothetical protein PC111_g17268 [Phytophthora cactorum]KAG2836940.1 hypothetical protein PC112_g5085 [Phytophthora cactorum]KAG2864296.1 hypothetical protein PC113_g4712 [Phytophthora cactorum]KAG2922884.1 hypothetical protein PC114_g5060 [Phytophthora cactorum]
MDKKTLARELVRARLHELADMKKQLDKVHNELVKMTLRVQLVLQSLLEESEERCYGLAAALDNKEDTAQDDELSFDILLELAINELKD